MYSQIYTKRVVGKGVVSFPNHAAIAEMRHKVAETAKEQDAVSFYKRTTECDELLLLTAMLALENSTIGCDLFSLIAAAILCV